MRSTRLALTLLVAGTSVGLSACAGAGRPSASDVLHRLNSAGVRCETLPTGLAFPNGARTSSACRTQDGQEIGVLTYDSDDKQKRLLENLDPALAGSVFRVAVYDYGYVLLVPSDVLGQRVADVMDAQSAVATGVIPCPQARGGVCSPL